jgi:hypothetical protein
MTTSVDLTLLKCLRCGTFVQAEEDEVAWVCAQCGQGLLLTETGLAPLSVQWAALPGPPVALQLRWLPFWTFVGTVRFGGRETYGGARQPDALWNAPRRFFVPAFPYPLDDLQQLGAQLTRRQPPLSPGQPAGPLSRCTLFPEDAQGAAEFVVLTVEAAQKDKLKQLSFALELGEPELWLLPFTEQGGLRLALG